MSARDVILFLVLLVFFQFVPESIHSDFDKRTELTYMQKLDLELLNLERNFKGDCLQQQKLIERTLLKLDKIKTKYSFEIIKTKESRTHDTKRVLSLKKQLEQCITIKTARVDI